MSIRWCETLSGLESAQPRAPPGGGRWRGTDAPVIADPARPAGQLAARPGRPGRCACRSDRREAAAYVDSGPWRCAPLERTGVPQPSQRPVPTAAELRRLAMEPDQLAGEQCLNAERPVHEHPPISGGRPASRPRCATGAHCDIRLILRGCWPDSDQVAGRPDTDILRGEPVGLGSLVCSWVRPVPRWRLCLPRIPAMGVG